VLLALGRSFSILTSKEVNFPPSGPKKPWSMPFLSAQNPQILSLMPLTCVATAPLKSDGGTSMNVGGGIEVNNETVFVPIGIKPESGSLIKVIDAQKVLVRTSGGGTWIKDRCKHAIDILPAKLKAVLIRPKPDDDGHVFVVNADGLGLSDRMARWRRPREVLHPIVGVRHENTHC
jgi:hypothetical protein